MAVADIFKEVDEEIRKDKAAELWRSYGSLVIALAVALVLGMAGYKGWRYFQEQQRIEQSDSFAAAMARADEGDLSGALSALGALAQSGGKGYPLLASFEQARLSLELGARDQALSIWLEIADSSKASKPLRGIAILLWALNRIEDGDVAEIRARVETLAGGEGPFRAGALEILAILALKEGSDAEAVELYRRVADDLGAPPALRARAAQMLAAFGE